MENLNSTLEQLSIIKIDTLEKFFEIVNLNELDEDLQPKIVTKDKSLIIFDNEDYNETYLIDLIKNHLENNKVSESIKIFYIDKLEIRLKVFAPKKLTEFEGLLFDVQNQPINRKDYEKGLNPGFMIIIPKNNTISIFKETMINIISQNNVTDMFKILSE